MRLLSLLAAGCAGVASVSAHATFQQLWINGVDAGSSCARIPQTGDDVTVEMHQQPGDRACRNEAIGGNHYGPVLVYMAAVTDARTAVGSASNWFKVSHMGLVSSNPDYFGSRVLNDNCGHYTFKIPANLAPGNYLLRAEVIGEHTHFIPTPSTPR
ncbi:hypothetical protein H0H81_003191 [Sphagnurus paluster]|uniref:AA9 family lytic polysaccharide monooxygenase n=1 Tax=Sphagnurus paluster TaxID=117069 RepID=A0A9P7K665_9AGAR|nr:hypothetical protein H0H81_003191 [Sphagnurus paluster]